MAGPRVAPQRVRRLFQSRVGHPRGPYMVKLLGSCPECAAREFGWP